MTPKKLGPKSLVKIGPVTATAEILLIWTNVTRAYVARTNVTITSRTKNCADYDSLPLVPYPLVLFLSQNLGEGYCHSCDCDSDCPQQKLSQLRVLGLRLEFDNIIVKLKYFIIHLCPQTLSKCLNSRFGNYDGIQKNESWKIKTK